MLVVAERETGNKRPLVHSLLTPVQEELQRVYFRMAEPYSIYAEKRLPRLTGDNFIGIYLPHLFLPALPPTVEGWGKKGSQCVKIPFIMEGRADHLYSGDNLIAVVQGGNVATPFSPYGHNTLERAKEFFKALTYQFYLLSSNGHNHV
ncbi:MAG: hypothetical protein Q7R53_00715 [bacterium]|nr:hypothetical protein [bacterium]